MQNSHWIKTRDNNETAVSSAGKQLGVNNCSRILRPDRHADKFFKSNCPSIVKLHEHIRIHRRYFYGYKEIYPLHVEIKFGLLNKKN